MKTSILAACAALGFFGSLVGLPVLSADEPGIEAKAAFEKLKSLAGEWEMTQDQGPPMKISYRVTANGSVVMETLFPGTPHEMVTMYHLDGKELLLTHYCAAGNQPHLKLDKKGSKADKLSFVFTGGTNFDPAKDAHMHSGWITFVDGNHIQAEWDGYQDGKKSGGHKFVLSRK